AIPDILEPGSGPVEKGVSLEWFSSDGRLLKAKQAEGIDQKFDTSRAYQKQISDRSEILLITEKITRKGHTDGYLRVGMDLAKYNYYFRNLQGELATALALSLAVCFLAVIFLVRQSLKPLQQSLERLTQFTADASHELKNPIMAIKTNAAVAL